MTGSIKCTSEHLYKLARALKNFGSSSETQFLAMGGWLRDFHGRAAKVSGQALRAAELISGPESARVIQNFELLLNDIEVSLRENDLETGRNRTSLKEVQQLINRLQQPMNDFGRIVKTLQILRLTTKVENSARGRDDIHGLAEGMNNLSSMIADKTAYASKRIEYLDNELTHAQLKLTDYGGRQSGQVLENLNHARSHLLNLVDRRQGIKNAADDLGDRSADISQQIGNIVASMQFHDITRQQIEHVHQTLERLGEELEHRSASPQVEQAEVAKNAIGEVCELQAAQLEHAQDELAGAVRGIILNLEKLAVHITATASDTVAIAGTTSQGERSFFSVMAPAIGSMTSVLTEMADRDRDSSDAVGSAFAGVMNMAGLVDEFELVGSEMRVVAANAGIMAAHAGDRGVALEVIAKAVQQLAGELLIQTGTLAADFTVISSAAQSLKVDRDGVQASCSLKNQKILDRGTELLNRLDSMNKECIDLLGEMERGALTLAEDITVALSSITVHHECRELVASVRNGLQGWFGEDRGVAADRKKSGKSAFVIEIVNRYSMQSERQIHERKTAIIRGEESTAVRWDPSGHCEENEFGANVEMF